MSSTERDAFVAKSFTCGEMARFDVGRPVNSLSASPLSVVKHGSSSGDVLNPRLPASQDLPVLQYNVSPIQRARAPGREDDAQAAYLASLQQAQEEAYFAHHHAQQQQEQYPQQQQQYPQQQQQQFLAASVNTRPTQPLSLDEAREAQAKKSKQMEYLRQLELTSQQAPIPTERVCLARATQQKRLSTGELSLQPAITVNNVLTGTGSMPVLLSPEAKRRQQEEFRRAVEEAQRLPATHASPLRRQSRPPSPLPILGPSSLQPIGLRDSPEFKRGQYEQKRAMVAQGLAESAAEGAAYRAEAYRTVPAQGAGGDAEDYYSEETFQQQQGYPEGYQQYQQQQQQQQQQPASHRAPLRPRGSASPTDSATPRTHVPSPAVQRVLKRLEDQRLAEAAQEAQSPTQQRPQQGLSEGAVLAEEAEMRRQQQERYSSLLQADAAQTPIPSSRVPVSSLRQANSRNDHSIYSVPQHTDRSPSLVDTAVGQHEAGRNDPQLKREQQKEYQRQLDEAASMELIAVERLSLARQAQGMGRGQGPAEDPFKTSASLERPAAHGSSSSGAGGSHLGVSAEAGVGAVGLVGLGGMGSMDNNGSPMQQPVQHSISTPSGLLALGLQPAPLSRERQSEARRLAQTQRVALLQADAQAAPVQRTRASLVSGRVGQGQGHGQGHGQGQGMGQMQGGGETLLLSSARSMQPWADYDRALSQQHQQPQQHQYQQQYQQHQFQQHQYQQQQQQQQQQNQQAAMTSARRHHATHQMHYADQPSPSPEPAPHTHTQSPPGALPLSPRYGHVPTGPAGSLVEGFRAHDRVQAVMQGHRDAYLESRGREYDGQARATQAMQAMQVHANSRGQQQHQQQPHYHQQQQPQQYHAFADPQSASAVPMLSFSRPGLAKQHPRMQLASAGPVPSAQGSVSALYSRPFDPSTGGQGQGGYGQGYGGVPVVGSTGGRGPFRGGFPML